MNLRLNRILGLKDRVIIVAMDHGNFAGPIHGIINIEKTLRKIINENFDGIILCPGSAVKLANLIGKYRKSLILRVDGARTVYGEGITRRISSVTDAIRIGADAIIAMGYIGGKDENESLVQLGSFAIKCREWNIPLIAEMIPLAGKEDKFNVNYIKVAARIGAEIGASMIKTYYTGSIESFREVVEGCHIPIVIAGGPKMDNDRRILEIVKDAIEAGAIGVAFGRNIWQHSNPNGMIRAIAKIVYDDAEVEDAIKELI
ncbi:MAG: fructose-bisphosphate aldolase [Candidatus Methanomethylicota archaeon]|uniref:Fructose-bisphosphate aldolase n=1 Tax=Thermoproteota archaeon TaxID=2056631 RepID=A0A497EQZ6_9CREN|nr:MAG: fructose-bisphosphate aldolase [Candidatus Verstraetearchaeota archaeon]